MLAFIFGLFLALVLLFIQEEEIKSLWVPPLKEFYQEDILEVVDDLMITMVFAGWKATTLATRGS